MYGKGMKDRKEWVRKMEEKEGYIHLSDKGMSAVSGDSVSVPEGVMMMTMMMTMMMLMLRGEKGEKNEKHATRAFVMQ